MMHRWNININFFKKNYLECLWPVRNNSVKLENSLVRLDCSLDSTASSSAKMDCKKQNIEMKSLFLINYTVYFSKWIFYLYDGDDGLYDGLVGEYRGEVGLKFKNRNLLAKWWRVRSVCIVVWKAEFSFLFNNRIIIIWRIFTCSSAMSDCTMVMLGSVWE